MIERVANGDSSTLGRIVAARERRNVRRLLLWFGAAAGLTSCAAFAGDLPNPNLTPGKADPALTTDVLCAPGLFAESPS